MTNKVFESLDAEQQHACEVYRKLSDKVKGVYAKRSRSWDELQKAKREFQAIREVQAQVDEHNRSVRQACEQFATKRWQKIQIARRRMHQLDGEIERCWAATGEKGCFVRKHFEFLLTQKQDLALQIQTNYREIREQELERDQNLRVYESSASEVALGMAMEAYFAAQVRNERLEQAYERLKTAQKFVRAQLIQLIGPSIFKILFPNKR